MINIALRCINMLGTALTAEAFADCNFPRTSTEDVQGSRMIILVERYENSRCIMSNS